MVIRLLLGVAVAALPMLAGADESPTTSPGDPGVELQTVIESYSKHSGKKFIVDPRARATVVVAGLDANRLTYAQLLTVLSVNGFASYREGDVIVVVPDASARQMPVPVFTAANFKAEDGEWVTLLTTPKNACAAHLVPLLRPMMPQAAHLAASLQNNSLVVVDHADNVKRIADLIDKLDRASPAGRGCEEAPKK